VLITNLSNDWRRNPTRFAGLVVVVGGTAAAATAFDRGNVVITVAEVGLLGAMIFLVALAILWIFCRFAYIRLEQDHVRVRLFYNQGRYPRSAVAHVVQCSLRGASGSRSPAIFVLDPARQCLFWIRTLYWPPETIAELLRAFNIPPEGSWTDELAVSERSRRFPMAPSRD